MAALGLNMKGRGADKEDDGKKPKKKVSKPSSKKTATAGSKASKKKLAAKSPSKNTKKVAAKAKAPAKKVVPKKVSVPPKVSAKSKEPAKKIEAKKPVPKKAEPKKVATVKEEKTVTAAEVKPKVEKKEVPQEEVLKLRNASFIVEPSKRRKIRKTKVIMEGDLNINNVDAFIQQIKPLFNDYDFIDFFMREVTSLDLSHLQMLYYFQNHFVKEGKTVTVDANLNGDFKKIIISNGFKEFMFIPKLV